MPNPPLDSCYDDSDGPRHPHKWGYADTGFEFEGRAVIMRGGRYALAGKNLPGFIPFVEEMLGVAVTPKELEEESPLPTPPPPILNDNFVREIQSRFRPGQISFDDGERLIRSHGQLSVGEIYRLSRGKIPPRIPDMIFFPRGEDDAEAIVALADAENVCLIPFGGGTNVSGALLCPKNEKRMIVSLDLREMNRLLWVDEDNMLACAEAGIRGKDLERELSARGFICGHEPDSVEFSSLGGWIATNASGMKKNRYGNIEDIVLSATLITPKGAVESSPPDSPRTSAGVQPRALLFGSEGCLGVVTKAVIKIHPLPRERKYGSAVFPTFADGINFLRELRKADALPESIRLVDNREFRFGQALKPKRGGGGRIISAMQKFFILRVMKFNPSQMVACTLVTEGGGGEAARRRRTALKIARRCGGVSGGEANGRRGYMLTFAIAYIRDFFSRLNIIGETFETSAPWTCIMGICEGVADALAEECAKRGVAGRPYLSHRVTQTYHGGACIYFTMGFCARGLAHPEETYGAIERKLREVILSKGGSLSHHHGIGKVRREFILRAHSPAAAAALREAKKSLDPRDIFAASNGVFGRDEKSI